MMILIAAALAAAQPAVPADSQPQQAPMMQMGAKSGEEHGQMAEMKQCCCKDMMAKMHQGHSAAHERHPAE